MKKDTHPDNNRLEEFKDTELFLRTDADRLSYDGVFKLIEKSFEYIFFKNCISLF